MSSGSDSAGGPDGESGGEVSDFEAPDSADDMPRPRGRPRTHPEDSEQSEPSGRRRGQHAGPRRGRNVLSPQEARERQDRDRRPPAGLGAEQAREKEARKAERKRKLEADLKTAEEAFNLVSPMHCGVTSASIAKQLKSGCCSAWLKPVAPRTQVGFHAAVLPFECSGCGDLISIETGKRSRLLLFAAGGDDEDGDAEDDYESEEDEGQQQQGGRRRKKRKKRKKTNSRPEGVVRAVMGALLAGQTYKDYRTAAKAQNMQVVHHTAFERYLGLLLPWIEKLQNETVDLCRYLVVRYGDTIGRLVLTHDFFWATRGHYARNGTGTMCATG